MITKIRLAFCNYHSVCALPWPVFAPCPVLPAALAKLVQAAVGAGRASVQVCKKQALVTVWVKDEQRCIVLYDPQARLLMPCTFALSSVVLTHLRDWRHTCTPAHVSHSHAPVHHTSTPLASHFHTPCITLPHPCASHFHTPVHHTSTPLWNTLTHPCI